MTQNRNGVAIVVLIPFAERHPVLCRDHGLAPALHSLRLPKLPRPLHLRFHPRDTRVAFFLRQEDNLAEHGGLQLVSRVQLGIDGAINRTLYRVPTTVEP